MLYDLVKNTAIDVPDFIREELKKTYPDFYAGKPLVLKTLPNKLQKSVKVRTDAPEDERYRKTFIERHNPIGWRAKANVTTPQGEILYLQYTKRAAIPFNNTIKIAEPNVDLEAGMHLHNPIDEDLLAVIHYGCKHLKGVKAGGVDPSFEFDRPGVAAIETISKYKESKKIQDFIYEKVEYSKIVNALNILGIPLVSIAGDKEGQEAANRIATYNKLVEQGTSDATKRNILEILGYVKAEVKNTVEESASDLVTRLVNEGKVKLEETGWHDLDARGDGTKFKAKPFFETTAKGDDARFALIDYFNGNEVAFDTFKKK